MKTTKSLRLEDLPDVLTLAEAQAVLRINKDTAYGLVRRREILFFRIGKKILIPKSGLEKMLCIPPTSAPQSGGEGKPRHTPQKDLTLRGSFVITVYVQSDDGTVPLGKAFNRPAQAIKQPQLEG